MAFGFGSRRPGGRVDADPPPPPEGATATSGSAGTPAARAALWLAALGALGLGAGLIAARSPATTRRPAARPQERPGTAPGVASPVSGGGGEVALVVPRFAITRALWLIVAVILIIGIAVTPAAINAAPKTRWAKYGPLLRLDTEQSLAAWFSTILLVGAAGLCYLASRYARDRDPANRRGWFVLSLVFVYLSFDEAASIHERIGWEVQAAFDLRGVFYFAWVLVAAPLVIILALLLRGFLVRLPSPIGLRILIAGVVFVAGALGCEMIASAMVDEGIKGFWYWTEVVAEEALEMAGVVLFIGAILDYLARTARSATVTLAPP